MNRNTTLQECLPDVSLYAWSLLGKRWTLQIITALLAGSLAYHELARNIEGISDKVLSKRLKELEREGVLRRQVHDSFPIRVTYHLTAKGQAIAPIINALSAWSHCL